LSETEATLPEEISAPGWEQWVFCADDHMQCECRGMIRWGAPGHWRKVHPVIDVPTVCSVAELGDPDPSVAYGKHCECAVQRGSRTWYKLSPAVLPEEDSSKPIVSCAKARAAAAHPRAEKADEALWTALCAFCGGEGRDALPRAGSLALAPSAMEDIMQVWLDPRFRKNYEDAYDGRGWVERAWVNYVGNCAEGGKYDRMMTQLLRSVHAFSKEPIVVVHFGMVPPSSWDPKVFPQLVLLHARPLPQTDKWRSFNFNKYRSMLLAKVRVGIELDADEFLAPGADAMFARTAAEVTEDYPFPILPVHFLPDIGPNKSNGIWWPRYCHDDGSCPKQTMRWGHAHPTWTFHALPWLGKWLRRYLRDEVLPPREGFAHSELRVAAVPEDEDLLNLALWEDGATKQWCKFETPDPRDFDFFLAGSDDGIVDIVPDPRFYPHGAPLVFYSAHHAIEPEASKRYLDKLEERQRIGNLPAPITYKGSYYRNGEELRKAHSDVRCLI